MQISAGAGLAKQPDEISRECSGVPRWAIRLIHRLGMLQRGHAYTLTVIMVGDEPVWVLHPLGALENER